MNSIWLKLIAIGAILGGVFWSAWNWRSALAEKELREAVDSAVVQKVGEIQTKIDEERGLRAEYQRQVNAALSSLGASLRSIQQSQAETVNAIAQDRAENKDFYNRPLPEKGRQAWIRARQAAAPASSPASSPQ